MNTGLPLKSSLAVLLCLCASTVPAAVTITNLAQGFAASHCMFLKSDGTLWAMGENSYGQLGDGSYYDAHSPEQITNNVVAAATGSEHTLLVKADGSLWGMGYNSNGSLGAGNLGDFVTRPEQIVPAGVVAVSASTTHSLFLKSDGSLWAMGDQTMGELGDGVGIGDQGYPYSVTNRPEQIVANGVTAIAAGHGFSLFLKSDGSLWAMGNNEYGQLGDGTTDQGKYFVSVPEQIVASGVTAIAAGGAIGLFLKSDGSLWTTGNAGSRQVQIVASGVTAIAAGISHSLFLKSDGSLWAMGNNPYGQLGDGGYATANLPEQIIAGGVVAIAAGSAHSLALKSDGSLWATGGNSYGQLGDRFVDGVATFEQVLPSPRPTLIQSVSARTNLQFTATCGLGGTFYLLAGTNLSQPLSQWRPVWTNFISYHTNNLFAATLTNALKAGPPQFYLLQSP